MSKAKRKEYNQNLINEQARQAHKDMEQDLIDMDQNKELDIIDMLNQEASESMDCHLFGPCERCLARSATEK
jgi:hypothetical protein